MRFCNADSSRGVSGNRLSFVFDFDFDFTLDNEPDELSEKSGIEPEYDDEPEDDDNDKDPFDDPEDDGSVTKFDDALDILSDFELFVAGGGGNLKDLSSECDFFLVILIPPSRLKFVGELIIFGETFRVFLPKKLRRLLLTLLRTLCKITDILNFYYY